MLTHKVALYVPTKIGQTAAPAAHEKWARKAKVMLSELFGGYTAFSAVGGWVGNEGLVEEDVLIVQSFTDGLDELPRVEAFARKMRAEMSQEAVSLEVDGTLRLYYAEPEKAAA